MACLEMLRDSGKKLFVGTNSLWVSLYRVIAFDTFNVASNDAVYDFFMRCPHQALYLGQQVLPHVRLEEFTGVASKQCST